METTFLEAWIKPEMIQLDTMSTNDVGKNGLTVDCSNCTATYS